MENDVILSVKNLRTAYRTRHGESVYAVDGVSFDLKRGQQLGIAGESGCGKSTLALSLMGFYFQPLEHLGGEVLVEGTDIVKLPYEKRRTAILGEKLAYIPQAAMNALNPTQRVRNFVWDIVREHGLPLTREQSDRMLGERFEVLGLPERALNAYPNELSGGMKQRVVIATSTILNPMILIADEPTSALDVTCQKQVMLMMRDMMRLGIVQSILYITHELPLLRQITEEILVMYAGQIVEHGKTDPVIFSPVHPYTKALMGSIIVPESEAKGWKIHSIPGAPPNLKERMPGCRFAQRCKYCGRLCQGTETALENEAEDGRFYRCCVPERKLREAYADE